MGACRRVVIFHTGGHVTNSHLLCSALPNRKAFHPITCALLDHPRLGPILFDTGLGSHTAELLSHRPMRVAARLARIIYKERYQLRVRLKELGVDPSEVKHAILSHLHFDHTGGARDLEDATFYVSRAEWERAFTLRGVKALLKGYVHDDFSELPVSLVDFQTPGEVWPFKGSVDLFGDGSVIAVSSAGHTAGHLSALVRLESGREVLLAGDAALVRQNFTIPADQGVVARRLRYDHDATWRVMLELREFWKQNPDAEIVTTHDGHLGRMLKKGPLELS